MSRTLADGTGAVLLHLDSTAYHGLDRIGQLIWDLLEEPLTFEELLTRLRRVLTAAPPELADDIGEFIGDLSRRDLVLVDAH